MDWFSFMVGGWCGVVVYALTLVLLGWRAEMVFKARADVLRLEKSSDD